MDNLFSNKRTYIDKDGNELINMCIPSIDMKKIKVNSVVRLNENHNGRLDKFIYEYISKDIDNGLDAVLYCNHIFNPFSVQADDIIYTPVVNDEMYQERSEPDLPDGTYLSDNSVKSNSTKQMTYAEKVEYFARLGLGIS